jgi:predicted DNA-binding protein (MmcQ/YjbR family)
MQGKQESLWSRLRCCLGGENLAYICRMKSVRDTIQALVKHSLGFAGVEEGVACKGTKLEARTFGVGKKSFLFVQVRETDCVLRLKLEESTVEALDLARKEPTVYSVGAQGWTKIVVGPSVPPATLLKRWVAESHRLVVLSKKK